MSEVYGPQGKRLEKPTHEEQLEKYRREYGFPEESKPEQADDFAEVDWGSTDRKSTFQAYWDRRGGRPKPAIKRELTKFETTKIAPNTTVADYLPQLLAQAKTLVENHARLAEKIAEFEAKARDECAKRGPRYAWVDSECIGPLGGRLPESRPVPTEKTFAKSVRSVDCGVASCQAKLAGTVHEHTPGGGRIDWDVK